MTINAIKSSSAYNNHLHSLLNQTEGKIGSKSIPEDKRIFEDRMTQYYRPEVPKKFFRLFSVKKNGQLLDADKTVFNRHTTMFCRFDVDWQDFGEYLQEKYSDNEKVNTYVWGCSTGAEAYTMSMLLSHFFENADEKFYPIKAGDINKTLISRNLNNQKNGVLINNDIFTTIYRKLGLDMPEAHKYFKTYDDSKLLLTSDVTNSVKFETSNILTDVDKINSKNPSIVMCRNMWPYINPDKYSEFAKKLYGKLAPGSIVVIGSFDLIGEKGHEDSDKFPQTLIDCGFKPIKRGVGVTPDKSRVLVYEK